MRSETAGSSDRDLDVGTRVALRLGLVLVVSLVYFWSMAPDVMTDDSAEFQVRCPLVQATHAPGYPLLLMIGKTMSQLPLATVSWRLTLLSVVFGVAAVVVLYELLSLLLSSPWVAFATSLVFAVSHTFWMQSVLPEAYSLNALFHAVLLYLLARYERFRSERGAIVATVVFLVAFATGNHQVIVLMLPVYIVWIWWQGEWGFLTWRRTFGGAAAFVLGASIYLVLAVRMQSLAASVELATGGPARGLLFVFTPAQVLKRFLVCLGYHAYQFPLIGAAIGLGGWGWALRRRRGWWALTTAVWLITVGYAVNFDSSDVYVFYIPAYLVFAIWIGFGFDALYRLAGSRPVSAISLLMVSAVLLPPVVYLTTCSSLEKAGQKTLTQDKDLRYYFFPPKNRADWFGNRMRHLIRTAAPGGAILTDWNYYFTARYLCEIEHLRRDLRICDVTPSSGDDPKPVRTLAQLARQGVEHFYLPHPAMARSARRTAGDWPCFLHTVGWYVGRDPYGAVRDARRRLGRSRSEVLRSRIPSVWDRITAPPDQARRAGMSDTLADFEGRTFLSKNVAICRRFARAARFAAESSRLLRGQGIWIGIENVRDLLPFDGWAVAGQSDPDRNPEGKLVGMGIRFARRTAGETGEQRLPSGRASFSVRRPLHENAGRFAFMVEFVFCSRESAEVTLDGAPGQAFFLDNTFYQYVLIPTAVRPGEYAVLLTLRLALPGQPPTVRTIDYGEIASLRIE